MTPTLELRIVDPGFVVRSNDGRDHQEVHTGEAVRKGNLVFLTAADFFIVEQSITQTLGFRASTPSGPAGTSAVNNPRQEN